MDIPFTQPLALTEGDFKTRYGGHIQSFNDFNKKSASTLSKYVWDKGLQPDPNVKYTILQRRSLYQPGSKNTNSEMKKNCIHTFKHKLINLVTSSAQ